MRMGCMFFSSFSFSVNLALFSKTNFLFKNKTKQKSTPSELGTLQVKESCKGERNQKNNCMGAFFKEYHYNVGRKYCKALFFFLTI